ncbi:MULTISPECIES: outer membrane protein [Shewanella]|uniref:outer membrane protein n=1 Tax=Shewanella TaxID=22 RepID=UPI001BBA1E50|nr:MULTISPECIES: outer membrane beta-barrel protein [Shewanella]GIU51109.1 membrane protein [Shewanella sp. KT0246]
MKRLSVVASAILMVGLSFNVTAEEHKARDTGWYVGGELSNVQLEVGSFDDSGAGFGAYGGYNFNHWFGIEGKWMLSNDLQDGRVDLGLAVFSAAPKFTWAINDTFSVFGKVGLAIRALEVDPDYDYDEGFDTADWSGVNVLYGVGITAAVSESLRLRLSYEYVTGDLDADRSEMLDIDADTSQLALGLHYQF